MIYKKRLFSAAAAIVGMLILILDARTALTGAQSGLELCYRTVIPSLFPFIVISVIISSNFAGIRLTILRPISKICGMPAGAESIFLLGVLGGYPVGAQSVYNAYENQSISKQSAKRLLGFCSNAGPAFIFGMMSSLFESAAAPWVLWGIHIISALLVGRILPDKDRTVCKLTQNAAQTVPQALEKGIKTISAICGWIILFRVVISFFQRWFLWLLPHELQVCLIATLELSNGFCEMYNITNQGARFILASGALAFGGICILMQTRSVTGDLGWGMYFPGKVLQTIISILFALIAQQFLFPYNKQFHVNILFYGLLLLSSCGIIVAVYLRKKVVAFSDRVMYNSSKILQI